MANKAKDKTLKQKATEAAYKALISARDAMEKSNNATTKANVEKAQTVYDTARNAERRERFTTVARDRAELVSVKLAALAKCANKKGYEFNEADIAKIETVLSEDLADCLAAFRSALTGKAPTQKAGRLAFE